MRWNDTTHIFEMSTNDGASWAILPLNASVINEGAINTARLPANIAYKDQANIFTANQQLSKGNPGISLIDSAGPTDAKIFNLINTAQQFVIQATNDAGTVQQGAAIMDHTGTFSANNIVSNGVVRANTDIYEKGRVNALGTWINTPFDASAFAATGGTWTIGAPAIVTNRYCLIGKVCVWQLYISWFSGSNVVGGNPTSMIIRAPAGMSCPSSTAFPVAYFVDAGAIVEVYVALSGPNAQFSKKAGGIFAAGPSGSTIGIMTTIIFEFS